MNDEQPLQAILGTDKKNPLFAVYRDPNKGELHVYYGFELLEVVPDDKECPRFRLMVAQLYNAGVKGLTLCDVFKVDPKNMRKWGRALRSGDPQTLVDALRGRGPRKLTPEIVAFIKFRFPSIYAEDKRSYSSQMREEIHQVFGVSLCSEALRPLFNKLKGQDQAKCQPSKLEDETIESNILSSEDGSGRDQPTQTSTHSPGEHQPPPQAHEATTVIDDDNAHADLPSVKKGALLAAMR